MKNVILCYDIFCRLRLKTEIKNIFNLKNESLPESKQI